MSIDERTRRVGRVHRAEAPLPQPPRPARRQADTRRACPPSRARLSPLALRRTVMLVRPIQFSKNRPRPRKASGSRMLVTPHPAGPKNRRTPFFGEPSNITTTDLTLSTNWWRWQVGDPAPAGRKRRGNGVRRAWLVLLSVCPAWGPGTSLLGDERRKRNSIIRAEGGLVNPYRSSLLESHIRCSLRRPRTPARFHGTLPHIRQANVHVTP